MNGIGGLQTAEVGQRQHYISSIGQLSAGRNRLLDVNVSISRAVVVCQQRSGSLEIGNEEVAVG